jgi:hypothetical protein
VAPPAAAVRVAENPISARQSPNVVREKMVQKPVAEHKFQQPVEKDAMAPFTVKTDLQGFKAEYDRILSRAQAFATTDPLMGVAEYQGLARFCEKHSQKELAISALRTARMLADQTGDEALKSRLDMQLSEVD